MPVTLPIVDHRAEAWKGRKTKSGNNILATADPAKWDSYKEILVTSFTEQLIAQNHISAVENGLVHGALEAYSTHHHLTIRPEDVWFAILTQISFYINANAEKLRDFFVSHQGQKHLEVWMVGADRYSVDFGRFAQLMADEIGRNVKDPALRDWVMPSFSTTTDVDRAVGGVLFMGALQKYFSYEFGICCGLPSVTLLGEVADYQDILKRLDVLERLGDEPAAMARLLRPVLEHMVLSFTEGGTPRVVSFWNKIVDRRDLGSGEPYMSGWITAFCLWSSEGKAQGVYSGMEEYFDDRNVYDEPAEPNLDPCWRLGDVIYPRIDVCDVPPGTASVPVLVNDNGEKFKCTMVAGSAALQATSPTAEQLAAVSVGGVDPAIKTAVQPMSGWFICVNRDQS
ncbi:hypothetical protein PWT90_07645 [Aphanocladium album]|nr:hypothetical protein PWT90_07645 [Aphanocladium album]